MNNGTICAIVVPCVTMLFVEEVKYLMLGSDGKVYSRDFFGIKLAFLMDMVPVVPELVMVMMAPFWLTYAAFKGIAKWTHYIDSEWRRLGK